MKQREIKFRGYSKDENTWVYGFPYIGIPETYYSYIVPEWLYNGYPSDGNLVFEKSYEVDYKTITQYTGKQDKNGREIYEGDIDSHGYVIMWSERKALFCPHFYQPTLERWSEASYPLDAESIEIVGNFYETPQLIKS